MAYRETIEQLKIHKNDQVRKEWPKYKLLRNCKVGCTRLIEIKHFVAKPKDIEKVLAFRITRPLQEILERKQELDVVHKMVNAYRVVQVIGESGVGKSLLISTLCFEF